MLRPEHRSDRSPALPSLQGSVACVLIQKTRIGAVRALLCVFAVSCSLAEYCCSAQVAQVQTESGVHKSGNSETSIEAEQELKTGTVLTRQGLLQEAIPHLLAAQSIGSEDYASTFNLGICYLGTRRYGQAIMALERLRSFGGNTAAVNNLLSQAYIGEGEIQRGLESFQRASAETPKDEKLYDFVADACTEHQAHKLGLEVVEQGLRQLPQSARLHYERALFLAQLDRFDEARPEFERAAALAPDSYISYLALVQEYLYDGKLAEADRVLHEGIKAGHRDYQMLSLLGTVLMHEGAAPGQAKFAEAREALEDSVKEHPNYSATQIALGKLYLMEGRLTDAIDRLETGRRMEPNNPAVYAGLAQAYQNLGDREKARQYQTELGRLIEAQDKAKSSR
jgi:predicted Zn-dependent protease